MNFINISPNIFLGIIVKLFNVLLYSGLVRADWCLGIKTEFQKTRVIAGIHRIIVELLFLVVRGSSYKLYSLWADLHKGLKIESCRAPLIIRFLGTKTKIKILAKHLQRGTFVKIIRKG